MGRDLTPDEVVEFSKYAGFKIVERLELPGQEAYVMPVPSKLNTSLWDYIANKYPDGLYSHQSEAISLVLAGEDIALATPTASGKSLVYMVSAAHMAMQDPKARILALYPARALIQDQIGKWTEYNQFGLSIGYIDGGVPQEKRENILESNNIVLMTPDVAHAWLLRRVGSPTVDLFLKALRLVVLDEAHVYEGVFGTNMAYFLRRLEATSTYFNIVASTATLGDPKGFMEQLTGRSICCFTEADDGSKIPSKTLLLARAGGFSETAELLSTLGNQDISPFLAFADSRKQVEQLVAAAHRQKKKKGTATGGESTSDLPAPDEEKLESIEEQPYSYGILPYRAGYEDKDRVSIQKALEHGKLRGVVATSALELGIDIGEINLVMLLTTPPSVKAFKQRLGRGGRSRSGICLVLDTSGSIALQGLEKYINRQNEPNWLYLDNRYIQYINVLCTARELEQRGEKLHDKGTFNTLPNKFIDFLENEINPTEAVPEDLFQLKQRGEAGPHHEFPLRSGIEKQFQVKGHGPPGEDSMGTLTFSQVLREAYPGGIYYYLARPYRVREFRFRTGEIIVKRDRYWTTNPISQSIVFPNFQKGIIQCVISNEGNGFLAESYVQVSERVLGFREKRGSAKAEKHEYGPGSSYYQRPLNNFFETTGVCWYFSNGPRLDEDAAGFLREAFCMESGILERDIGMGYFTANISPVGTDKVNGLCFYDGVAGSLRLTQLLFDNFKGLAETAFELASAREGTPEGAVESLMLLAEAAYALDSKKYQQTTVDTEPTRETDDEEWVKVIAPGEKGTLTINSPQEVTVVNYRYTPKGLMYEVDNPSVDQYLVPASKIRPIYGGTNMLLVNLITGEQRPCGLFCDLPE